MIDWGIVNNALIIIGVIDLVENPEESTDNVAVTLAKQVYHRVLKEITEEFPWTFTDVVVPLTQIKAPSDLYSELWTYYYQYPTVGEIRSVHYQINTEEGASFSTSNGYNFSFGIEYQKLGTLEGQRVIGANYIPTYARVMLNTDNVQNYPRHFIKYFEHALALRFYTAMTSNRGKMLKYSELYSMLELISGKSQELDMAGQESHIPYYQSQSLAMKRYGLSRVHLDGNY